MKLPLREEEAALITAALGILDALLPRSGYPDDVQLEMSKRCEELINRIQRVRQETYDFQGSESETEA